MPDLAGQACLDKSRLIGGCLRLPLSVDAARLAAECAALPASLWGTQGGRVGVHRVAEAIFLRGHAPAEGERPIGDREPLGRLPYVREIVTTLIAAPAQRCLLARLPGGATVAAHIDQAPYFARTIRIHVPVETHDQVWMFAGGYRYRMAAGEVWALDNSAPHGVRNEHASLPRTHLICDFLPVPALLALLARGERGLGRDG